MKRIAIYYRVSTDEQDLNSQMKAVETWLDSRADKPDAVEIFKEIGRSGADKTRPEFNRLMHMAKLGVYDTVVVYAIDRFSRSSGHFLSTVNTLFELGIGFFSVSQPHFNFTAENPFRFSMLALFSDMAQLERNLLVMRTKDGLKAARKRGVQLGRRHTLNEQKQKEVKAMVEEGKTPAEITREINIKMQNEETEKMKKQGIDKEKIVKAVATVGVSYITISRLIKTIKGINWG